jgi:hypothetical protein
MAYSRRLDARIDASGKVVLSEASNSGTASLAACRAGGNGIEFIQWVDAETRGPIEFVDAKGNTTLTIPQMDDIDDPKQLKGKVGFADPTFGGILPGMTNDRFWDDLSALANSPGQRTHRCQDVEGPDGWVEYRCETSIPPNPSDLDYLVYYLYWLDRGF